MGYSRKNPHLPDGWQTGNPGGRGGREGLEIQVGGGMQARKFVFRGQFRGIYKMKVEGKKCISLRILQYLLGGNFAEKR